MPKDNRQLMGNKWEKARASRDAAATKMSTTWTSIFSARENNKDERCKLMLDAQNEMTDWDRKRTEKKLEIEREKIELEKQEVVIKWELKKAKTFGEIELEKKRLQLSWDAEDAKIMLANETLLDEHAKKWHAGKKKEINERREYETARAATAAAEHTSRMHAEHTDQMQSKQTEQDARMASEQAAWMASSE